MERIRTGPAYALGSRGELMRLSGIVSPRVSPAVASASPSPSSPRRDRSMVPAEPVGALGHVGAVAGLTQGGGHLALVTDRDDDGDEPDDDDRQDRPPDRPAARGGALLALTGGGLGLGTGAFTQDLSIGTELDGAGQAPGGGLPHRRHRGAAQRVPGVGVAVVDEVGLTHLVDVGGQVVVEHWGAGGVPLVMDHFEKTDWLAAGGDGRGPVAGVDGLRGGLGAVEESGCPGVDAPRLTHRDLALLAGALTHLRDALALHECLGLVT